MTRVSSRRRPRHLSRALGFASSLALLFAAAATRAQVDLYPPAPNVLLLVDTSGSMEYKIDGSEVSCSPGNPAGTNEKSRWIQVIEALTGTIDNYSCEKIDRLSTAFRDGVYRLNGQPPYDYNYTVPFHRALSNGCAAMPGVLPGPNAFVYPTGAISFKHYASMTPCTFSQQPDGIIDNFGALVRFGLMTFDTSTDPGTGVNGTSPNLATGIAGTWSYVVGSSVKGAPIKCDLTDQEVGARNAAAPAWEGRMVNFGNPSTGLSANLTKAQQIEDIIRATRPFGATPIAGMLKDAEDFFRNDQSIDQDPEPAGATLRFGPSHGGDPYVQLGCREQSILLLSDGQPNLDLRPECEGEEAPACPADDPDCKCPFDRPENIALRLASHPSEPVKTSVIAFALSSFTVGGTTMTCSDDAILDSACADPGLKENHDLQACCTLRRIARDGGGVFASAGSAEELRAAMNQIISANIKPSSRTQPVLASSTSGAASTQRFFSSFRPMKTEPWQGVLERQRYECVDDTENPGQKVPEAQVVDADKGDKFAENLATAPTERNFYTVRSGTGSDTIDPRASIRPGISDTIDDGVGKRRGSLVHGRPNAPGSDFFSADIAGTSMGMPKNGCGTTNATACGRFFLNWLVGNPNTGSDHSRCASPTNCNLLGDILHSTPKVVGRPVSLLRDETYSKFAYENAKRPVVLYVSTNDGILHAFKTASNDPEVDKTEEERVLRKTQNELWAFIPPAVLPDLYKLYPQNHELLLDGVPVVKDVVAIYDSGTYRFERTVESAQSASNTWRTVLIQSFGPKRSGYFALDVTEPVPSTGQPLPDVSTNPRRGGPRFLWQLTQDEDKNPLFGQGGVTPLITTLFFDPDGGGDEPREIAVAILPGGPGSVGTPGAENEGCSTADSAFDLAITGANFEGIEPRTHVKCYAEHPGAHSLTVVRLDTGEIVRSFRRDVTGVSTKLQDRVTITKGLDSPVTGQPVAYPADVGAVADRVFVGDADGRLWKVDLASQDPEDWSMKLFFDAFPTGTGFSNDVMSGQPIQTPPVLSVDEVGNITVAFSTGDQDTGGTVENLTNYVWSLTEVLSSDRQSFETKVNWYKPLRDGERVTGAMALFSSELFFSTYKGPGTTDVCSSGTSNIYGMHYLIPKEDTDGDDGGAPTSVFGGAQFATAGELAGISPDSQEQPIVFGVTVAQLPTCITDQTGTDDDWLGLGQHSTVTHVNPGKFQLLMQAGRTGQSIQGAETKTITKELETPQTFSSVDSWTAILE
jgi:type IV pilus assembly protein PilY1